ncbi:MAG: hypothetical protein LAT68_17215 [Cyclobacteriaceae bacterium]|nr:hypothetical protein [Cyclobacteriaceae bacterium]MCH8518039.1 hypothetical protein [Cyclobacteriaceae bacterium]
MKKIKIISLIMTVAILTGLTVFALTHQNNFASDNEGDKNILLADISNFNYETENEINSDTETEEKEETNEKTKPLTDKIHYQQAFEEITKMLTGHIPMDFKRAVFLTENAFHNGQLDYNEFSTTIATTGQKLKSLIKERGLQKYKTAGNWAIFSYMTDSLPINNFQPYTYDFDDFMGEKDWTSMFVTKLMKTKSGNCHSMPYYYKILAKEIGAEAYLALAPNHIYIKHKDENGQWTNLELTNGGFPRDQWIIKQMAISVEAIKNEIYMTPLSETENIAMCLFDLASAYERQYEHDEFELKVIETGLKYFPKCMPLLMAKANHYREIGMKSLKDAKADEVFLKENHRKFTEVNTIIDELGYKDMPVELYEEWVKSVDDEKKKRIF